MSKTRKKLAMTIIVSVPVDMSPADARREVRTLINEQCNYAADDGDVKARSVRGAGRVK